MQCSVVPTPKNVKTHREIVEAWEKAQKEFKLVYRGQKPDDYIQNASRRTWKLVAADIKALLEEGRSLDRTRALRR